MPAQFDTLLQDLAAKRNLVKSCRDERNAILEAAKQTPAYQLADTSLKESEASMTALEESIRKLAISDFYIDGNKHPHPKIEIKVFDVVELTRDKIGALKEWCFANFRPALKLDETKCVEAAKKNDIPAEFFSAYSEPRAQIATKLD